MTKLTEAAEKFVREMPDEIAVTDIYKAGYRAALESVATMMESERYLGHELWAIEMAMRIRALGGSDE